MALLVMGTLGLGIAVNTAVFSWVDSGLLRPIPGAAEPGQLAVLEELPRLARPSLARIRISGIISGKRTCFQDSRRGACRRS